MITQRAGRLRTATLAVLLLLLSSLAVMLGAQPAHAASRVDVSPTPSASGETTVTLSGSGFQYQPNAPGGVYVFFGAVSDPSTNAWAPSQGGKSGQTFSYASTGGAQLLVAFKGGASAEAANAMIESNGSWQAQMRIPGSKFEATFGDPHSGNDQHGQQIDCLQVQCGIITIGAHGMVNANNESFTPVSFDTGGGQVESGSGTVQDFGAGAGSGEKQSNNDEATKLDVPGGEDGSEGQEEAVDEAAPQQLQTADSDASANSMLTGIVIAVLGFAVVALVVAVVLVAVKRARAKRAAGGAGPPAAGGGAPPGGDSSGGGSSGGGAQPAAGDAGGPAAGDGGSGAEAQAGSRDHEEVAP